MGKSEPLEANLFICGPQELHDICPRHIFWGGTHQNIISIDRNVGWGVVLPKMEVASCTGWDWVPMEQNCGLHGGGFPADTIILSIQEQIDRRGCQEQIFSSTWQDDTIGVMVLHILKAKLGCAAVGVGLGIIAGTETKEEGNDQ